MTQQGNYDPEIEIARKNESDEDMTSSKDKTRHRRKSEDECHVDSEYLSPLNSSISEEDDGLYETYNFDAEITDDGAYETPYKDDMYEGPYNNSRMVLEPKSTTKKLTKRFAKLFKIGSKK